MSWLRGRRRWLAAIVTACVVAAAALTAFVVADRTGAGDETAG